jgi:hypothetical protein
MGIYYRLYTSGDETNLQVYSLQQAAKYWNDLINDRSKFGEEEIPDLRERLVFIVNCLGLSLSQLLGQNWPCPNKDEIDDPGTLLGSILKHAIIDRPEQKRLNKGFQEFLEYYNAVRHFGLNRDQQTYDKVDEITLIKVLAFRNLCVEIWDTILNIFKLNDENDLDDIRSITDVICFKDIAEQTKD